MLRPYVNQQPFDTGSDTFSLAPDVGARVASGFAKLGDGIQQGATALARADLQIQSKNEAIAKRDGAYRDEVEYIRLGDRLQQYSTEMRDKVGDDAAGYARKIEEYAREQETELAQSGRLSSGDDAKHGLMFERLRSRAVGVAATYEFEQRYKFRAAMNDDQLTNITSEVALTGAAGLQGALEEWRGFNSRTEGDTRIGRTFLALGEKRIKRAALEAEALRRGPEYMAAIQGVASETPSAFTPNPLVNAVLKHAPANGLDPHMMAAIGHIESRLDTNHDGPRLKPGSPRALGRKGATHMSSAEGGWQALDEVAGRLGIKNKFDPEESTAAIAKEFARYQGKLKASGFKATDGQTYMMWNVGEGVAQRILTANPNTPIEQIIYSSYPSRPAFAAQVLRNNPSMYRAGMTAGQVMQNYERKMSNARSATAKYFDGAPQTTDEQLGGIVGDFMGGSDMTGIGRKEAVEIFATVSKQVKEATAKERKFEAGAIAMTAPSGADPYDTEHQSNVNEYIDQTLGAGIVQGLAQGDRKANETARDTVRRAGFIPDKVVHGFRAALDGGSTDAAMLAVQSLADISTSDPIAYGASKLKDDEKEAAADFRALTEISGFSPADAVKYILDSRKPETKAAREATKERFKQEWRNGGTEVDAQDRAWGEITKKFDKYYSSTPQAATDLNKGALVDAYQRATTFYRLQGLPVDTAKARAMDNLNRMWGVSDVSSGENAQQLMPLPPEKVLGDAKRVNGSFSWVREQARNKLAYHLIQTGRLKTEQDGNILIDPATGTTASPGEAVDDRFRLIPSPGSAEAFRNGRPVSYTIQYKDEKGLTQFMLDPFTPDYADAVRKDEEDFTKRREVRAKAAADQTTAPALGDIMAP